MKPDTAPLNLARWLKEPLLHFLLLGGLLFLADHLLNPPEDDPRIIAIDHEVDKEARAVFQKARGREPTTDELYALRRVWLDNEVMYREGIALGMDKGDDAIRDRVIFKSLSMINAGLKRPPVDDAILRAWFEQRRAKYDEPARYDFLEAVLAGDADRSAAEAFAAKLASGVEPDAQTEAGLRVFQGRPHDNLVQSYGEDFTSALTALPLGQWRALPVSDGWRVMRLDAVVPARAAEFELIRGVVLQDWTDEVMAEQRAAAVKAMAQNYTIVVSEPRQEPTP